MPKTTTPLTLEDLQKALEDERHLGWGYKTGRDDQPAGRTLEADEAVIRFND